MAFQVGKPKGDSGGKRASPPNYFSRRVQRRLFVMVAMLMLVFWMMDQARRPQNWYWLWGGNPDYAGGPPLTDEELAGSDRDVDTRLRAPPKEPVAPDVFTAETSGDASLGESAAEVFSAPQQTPEDERVEQTRRDAWTRILAGLPSDDEELLRAILKAARDATRPAEETLQQWPATVERIDQGWDRYLEEAFQYLLTAKGQLDDQQRAAWHAAVQRLELEWGDRIHPALSAAGQVESLTPQQRQTLAAVQETLDQVALAGVRDNAVFRSAERHAWFRLLEKLDRASLDELENASTGRVGFVQIFDQPQAYRGKLVTVRGSVHRAYRVQAPKNLYGINGYYVFWLAPAGGPNSPICVYALETPPGFPALKDKDQDRATTTLYEDVEFTGYFFKRWAYNAQDGLRIAPLVLAKSPRWTPSPVAAVEVQALNPYALATYACGAMAIAVTISLLAYWQGRWRSAKKRAYAMAPDQYKQRLKSLEENDPAEDVRETLRRLSEEQK